MITFLTILVIFAAIAFFVIALVRQGAFESKEARAWKYFLARANEFEYYRNGYSCRKYRWKGPDGCWIEALVYDWNYNPSTSIFRDQDCILTRNCNSFSAEMARRLIANDKELNGEETNVRSRSRKRSVSDS